MGDWRSDTWASRDRQLITVFISSLARHTLAIERMPVKVLILSHGTRGDVQPFVALAHALDRAGHDVTLGIPPSSKPLAEVFGIDVATLTEASDELRQNPRFHNLATPSYRGWEYLTHAARRSGHLLASVLEEISALGKLDPDLIVHNPAVHGHQLAERLGIPAVAAYPLPALVPTRSFPNPMFPFTPPRSMNRATYMWTQVMFRAIFGRTDRWRSETLKLPPRRAHMSALRRPDGKPATVLHAFSPYIFPSEPHYPPSVHTTGFWHLPAPRDWVPSQALSDFLAAGNPPVYVGFASRIDADPVQTGHLVASAARSAGVRVLVVGGSGGGIRFDGKADDLFYVNDVPFDWLFSRVAAVVHHGGVGTTGAALAAGRPQVICPFIPSQRFVARSMFTRGIACAPIEPRRLTTDRLANAIHQAITDRRMVTGAAATASKVRSELGVARAVEIVERELEGA